MSNEHSSRRSFLQASAAATAGAVLLNTSPVHAAGSDVLKVALVGSGGRGRGAAENALNADKTDYVSVLPPGTAATRMPHPMPISITFFAGQGDEPTLIKIGTAYESATHHRFAPPDFGPVAPLTPSGPR